ncbi:MAG: hypothetical protein M5U19_11885 [Microthrixaceae bacterium]|nr:hypothetical protein [Microthrixaceae bacterium]
MAIPSEIDQVVAGVGPTPGGLTPASPDTWGIVEPKMLLIASITMNAAEGSAMSTPTVPTRRAATGALARRRNSVTSSSTPRAGGHHEDGDDRRRQDRQAEAVG